MNIDFKKLKEAIHDIHREIKAQKGDGPSGAPTAYRLKVIKEQARLYAIGYKAETAKEWENFAILRDTKAYATVLYSMRAHHRDKIHATKRRNPYSEAPDYVPFSQRDNPPGKQPKFLYPTLKDQERLIEPFIHEFEAQTETVG